MIAVPHRVVNPGVLAEQMANLCRRAALARVMGEHDVADDFEERAQAIAATLDREQVREAGVS